LDHRQSGLIRNDNGVYSAAFAAEIVGGLNDRRDLR
jgi:hypothetical protein